MGTPWAEILAQRKIEHQGKTWPEEIRCEVCDHLLGYGRGDLNACLFICAACQVILKKAL